MMLYLVQCIAKIDSILACSEKADWFRREALCEWWLLWLSIALSSTELSLVWSDPLLHVKWGVAQTGLEDAPFK